MLVSCKKSGYGGQRRGVLTVVRTSALSGIVMLILCGCQLARSVTLYQEYWSVPRGEPGGLRYVALGDSAAQGIGASDPTRSYVGVLAARLQALTGKPVQLINISQSGARIADVVRDQLPQLFDLQPDIITVDVGGNDIGDWDPVAFAEQARVLCAGLPPAKTVIAEVPSFMHGRWRNRSKEAANILNRECASRGVAVAALHAETESRGVKGMFTLFATDWFHPNDRGHQVWADVFWPLIVRLESAAAE